jgi:diaminohydroxyphosphoribosylaminopyrimidine deaminase/5-amino-6-(5-phosphoribosylamino)uracil reductase
MAQALALAALGEGATHPNPLVGCVVVRDGDVVGRGVHRAAGAPHAECVALAQAGARARGATLYVNLEPCAHQGRTGPCAPAIAAAGIARVVAAIPDPNPLVDGRGFATLRAAGIAIDLGLRAAEARALNAPFLSVHERRRPWVTLKAAQSLDGRIAAVGGSSTWVTGTAARRYAHRLRFRHDAVLVGATTVRRDDPALTVRLAGVDAPRIRAVLAPRGGLPTTAKIFDRPAPDWPPTRVYVDADGGGRGGDAELSHIAAVVPVARGASGLDLEAVLDDLMRQGAQSVLVEGGGKTAAAFLRAGRVDEIVLFVAPRIFGASGATPVVDAPAADEPARSWRLASTRVMRLGSDLVVTGRPEVP